MTSLDAAGLAVLGLRHRRLAATVFRVLTGRAAAEDHESLPERHAGESMLAWACRCGGRPPDEAARIVQDAQAQLDRAAQLGVQPIALGSPSYPPLLEACADPPALLWVRGQAHAWSGPAVAIVGSRAATPYGLAMARRLAADLAAAGVVVVSGLARGIDAAAHAAVIQARGRTIGVLGCGPDRIYPPEHGSLAVQMQTAGAVVSEFPPGVPPLAHHFPRRNRIISGLSQAVVVVEAAEKSGALITASAAADQGREVMVVPGQALSGRNRGGHLLIRDGATIVETADDILQGLTAAGHVPPRPVESQLPLLPDAVDFTVDNVAAQTGETPGAVLARLLELELSGRIQRIGGRRFARVLT